MNPAVADLRLAQSESAAAAYVAYPGHRTTLLPDGVDTGYLVLVDDDTGGAQRRHVVHIEDHEGHGAAWQDVVEEGFLFDKAAVDTLVERAARTGRTPVLLGRTADLVLVTVDARRAQKGRVERYRGRVFGRGYRVPHPTLRSSRPDWSPHIAARIARGDLRLAARATFSDLL
jgi:hypothetical protein